MDFPTRQPTTIGALNRVTQECWKCNHLYEFYHFTPRTQFSDEYSRRWGFRSPTTLTHPEILCLWCHTPWKPCKQAPKPFRALYIHFCSLRMLHTFSASVWCWNACNFLGGAGSTQDPSGKRASESCLATECASCWFHCLVVALGLLPIRSNVHAIVLTRLVLSDVDYKIAIESSLRIAILASIYVYSRCNLLCDMHKSLAYFLVALDEACIAWGLHDAPDSGK